MSKSMFNPSIFARATSTRFSRDDNGTVAIITAVVISVLLLASGLAVDSAVTARVNGQVARASDAANLTAARAASELASQNTELTTPKFKNRRRHWVNATLEPTLPIVLFFQLVLTN
jgi:Flp pilus assembly protein TadG